MMNDTDIAREKVAAKIAELVSLCKDADGVSIPRRFGFLLGELQGLEITLRHGGCGVDGAADRYQAVRETPEVR